MIQVGRYDGSTTIVERGSFKQFGDCGEDVPSRWSARAAMSTAVCGAWASAWKQEPNRRFRDLVRACDSRSSICSRGRDIHRRSRSRSDHLVADGDEIPPHRRDRPDGAAVNRPAVDHGWLVGAAARRGEILLALSPRLRRPTAEGFNVTAWRLPARIRFERREFIELLVSGSKKGWGSRNPRTR